MSTKPRTPEHFPRMKVRGARRRRLAPRQLAIGRMHRAFEGLGAALHQIGESARYVTISIEAIPLDEYTIVE